MTITKNDNVIRDVPKLKDITDVAVDNDACVVLRIMHEHMTARMPLISMGCFNGNETMFRLTKGQHVDCTVFYADGTYSSWGWGGGSRTMVSKAEENAGRLIQECIERDYGIQCQTSQRPS